jgi:hypothetical protein
VVEAAVGDGVGFEVSFVVGAAVGDAVGFAEGFTVGFVVGGNVVAATGDGVVTITSPPWGNSILTLKTAPPTISLPAAPPLPPLSTEAIRSRCTSVLPSETEATPRRAAEVVEAIVRSRYRILIEALMDCILRCCFVCLSDRWVCFCVL